MSNRLVLLLALYRLLVRGAPFEELEGRSSVGLLVLRGCNNCGKIYTLNLDNLLARHYSEAMQKRSSNNLDTSSSALVEKLVTSLSSENDVDTVGLSNEVRHLIAVALGRQGGLKGGKARAKKLSAKKRSAIAKKAAHARWGSHKKK